MPAATEKNIALNVIAKMDAFAKDLQQTMPDITAKGAQRAALKMQKQFTAEVVKQFKDVENAAKRTTEKTAEKFAALGKQVGAALGGPLGRVTTIAIEMTQKMDAAAATVGTLAAQGLLVGGTFAAAAVSVGLYFAALNKVAAAASDAAKRLVEAGRAAELPPEALEQIAVYDMGMRRLAESTDLVKVSVGAGLAHDFGVLASTLATLIEKVGGLTAAWDLYKFTMKSVISLTPMVGPGIVKIGEALFGFASAAAEANREAEVYEQNLGTLAKAIALMHKAREVVAKSNEAQRIKDEAAALKAQNEELKRQAELYDLIASHNAFAARKQVADTGRVQAAEKAAADERLSAYEMDRKFRLFQAAETERLGAEAAARSEERFLAAVEQAQAYGDAVMMVLTAINDRNIQLAEEELAREEEQRNTLRDRRNELEQQLRDADDETTRSRLQNRIDDMNSDLATQRTMVRVRRAELIKLANNQKAAGIFQATIETAAAVAKTLGTLGVPAGIPASILAGVMGGAQIAAINSQPLPSFFRGTSRVPDQDGRGANRMETHGGEAVMTSGGVEALGRMLVEALNSGRGGGALGGGGGGNVYLDMKLVGRVIAEDLSRNPTGPLATSIRTGMAVGYSSPWGRN
jgi:hypothetical protein